MAEKLDIKDIQSKINRRKQELTETVGVDSTSVRQSKDQFLSELMRSKSTGVQTNASQKLKAVADLADSKAGSKTGNVNNQGLSEALGQQNNEVRTPPPQYNNPNELRERDDKFNAAMNSMQYKAMNNVGINPNATIGEAANYYNTPNSQGNGNMMSQQMMLNSNPQVLNEQLNNIANNFLAENFPQLVSDAMKNTIVEQYKVERVKVALQENKDLIKGIVIEVIKELQQLNNSK